ncbi:nuclear transport factor 2 family protein [Roseateles sp.]|uniref:nuclear transport factor 2 family protein n=1 Tax=Roseateles sp. TaxID=1971397 RepID=UPI0025F4BD1F|nr:nuclear transport factor 2 family protein [Roseateles sp.]MBV8037365.1 nuclear transport factor 2 family protein [Roseateles sp.]
MQVTDRVRVPLAIAACLLLVLAGGCTTTPRALVSPPLPCDAPGSDCTNELMQALEDWKEAYNSRDPRRLQRLYAPGALITDDEYSAVPLSGTALPLFFDEMAKRPTARMRWVVGNLKLFGETAVRSGECEFSEQADGRPPSRPVRYSFAYQRIDGRWLIVLQHTTLRP